jgi:hypothetical protein
MIYLFYCLSLRLRSLRFGRYALVATLFAPLFSKVDLAPLFSKVDLALASL